MKINIKIRYISFQVSLELHVIWKGCTIKNIYYTLSVQQKTHKNWYSSNIDNSSMALCCIKDCQVGNNIHNEQNWLTK